MAIKKTQEKFIEEAKNIHKNLDFSNTYYTNSRNQVQVFCLIHKISFMINAQQLLLGDGCKKCSDEKRRLNSKTRKTQEEFIEEIQAKNLNLLLDQIAYKNVYSKVLVGCKIHGYYETSPRNLLMGSGCRKCVDIDQKMKIDQFIEKAIENHGEKYDYSHVDFSNIKNAHDKIPIVCPRHGIFTQSVSHHIYHKTGCPNCNESKGEKRIAKFLDFHHIKYKRGKRFDTCKNRYPLPFDFYLIDYNVLIEFDGAQHNIVVNTWGGQKKLDEIKKHDNIKTAWCQDNNIPLIRISYMNIKEVEEILTKQLLPLSSRQPLKTNTGSSPSLAKN